MTDINGVLFLCVANSARSQMAEGIARCIAPSRVRVYSAGSRPSQVNPFAVRAMKEVGINITSHRSKPIADIPLDGIDVVITLCAEEVCPTALRSIRTIHWPLADPADMGGSSDRILSEFRRVRDELRERISSMF